MRIKLSKERAVWLLQFHWGQDDPLYAIGSRLVAYGETTPSVGELERILETCYEILYDGDSLDVSNAERRWAKELGAYVYSLKGVRDKVSSDFKCFG